MLYNVGGGEHQVCSTVARGYVYFQTKNPNLGNFWRTLHWKILMYFKDIWNILRTFGIVFYHLVHFVFIWYNFFPVLVPCTKKNLAPLAVWFFRFALSIIMAANWTILMGEVENPTCRTGIKAAGTKFFL
jgi:hypothetical protein